MFSLNKLAISQPSTFDAGNSLEALQQQCLQLTREYTEGYIWQREIFALRCSELEAQAWHRQTEEAPSRKDTSACLWGQTSYGDNVEDEWFIVWLLMELTRKLPITARIWDSDGEFLLTEAAYVLPE